jgi:hypothetical protein
MTRKLGWLLLVIAWSAIASAAVHSGKVSGYVRDSKGVAQTGAEVEVVQLGSQNTYRTLTDPRGFFAIANLMPGNYSVKVSLPSFLPHLTQNLSLQSGAALMMNITLNTLFEAITLMPDHKDPSDDKDDWKWTLRSMANRPILRMVNGSPIVVSEAKSDEDVNHTSVAFMAGSQAAGFGSSGDYGTAFDIQQSMGDGASIIFQGNVISGAGSEPGGVVRAAYRRQLADGSTPELAIVARRIAGLGFEAPGLQSFAMSASNTTQLMRSIEISYGGEAQTIQFAGEEQAFRPFANVDWHLTPNTVVAFRYATSVPNTRNLKGFDTAPADLSESDPRVTLENGRGVVEDAAHQEISVQQRFGKNSIEVAAFTDRVNNAELTGVGIGSLPSDVLPDVYSGTFSYNGGNFSSNGMRIVFERKLPHGISATMDYAFGGVLDLSGSNLKWDEVRGLLQTHNSQALTAKVAGSVPGSHTKLIASYRWMNGAALTPVDMFNVSPGQADPYLNIFIRQPIPMGHFMPGKIDAVIDVRNLLAQGYIPVLTQDGGTVYLVQSARSVRGGVAFTF